jgi:uncharacterized membrane protein YoaK (UPF0700 family)
MFKHKGKSRTYIHNLRLASILSFVAGIVNITGVLSVKTLTTNVTGHFAFFSEELSLKNYQTAFIYLLFILFFLVGAFVSNFLIEIISRIKPSFSYAVPMTIEIIILAGVGIFGSSSVLVNINGQIIACTLLFSMGLQNALVTKASQSVVRTTHLTGLFTDLGIELSQLFFYRKTFEAQQLKKSIWLKLAIIGCFFLGCIVGGVLFKSYELETLLVASVFLIIALFYDSILFYYYNFKRRVQSW